MPPVLRRRASSVRSCLLAAALALLVAWLQPAVAAVPAADGAGMREAEDAWFSTLEWRCIGPSRGGRCQTVVGIPGDRRTYYMGSTGGGVWKTEDAGTSWRNVTDGFVGTGSVGALAVAPSNPNVVYVGMGEVDIRGNFSHGDGVYRSLDAGKTWEHLGLGDTRQIARIVVHPADEDVVYVAALGHVWGPNEQRGVFRSTDGGESWERIHFVSRDAGAIDLCMDPGNPRVLYAAFWDVRRRPWSLSSGGPGSGLWKSTDGGESWTELGGGLPRGVLGKIGVAVSPVDSERVWAQVEAEDGGLYRSDDGGESWRRVNDDRSLRQRAWYYTKVIADTQSRDTVYVMNVRFHKSIDGGRTFSTIRVPHVDNHDLWIDPDDNQRMINGNDGGANVSEDGGATWSRQDNQPTAQFYRVTTDSRFPYRVYGAQQDNSTVSISSETRLGWREEHYAVGGGESGYIAVHPENPDIVYAGSYSGYLTRYDHSTGKVRNVTVWPENPMGDGIGPMRYRFQWTFPIVFSPHDPDTIYTGGNVVFRSRDEGASWEPISPDLTTDDESKQVSSGGPITQDNTGVEYYCTVFTIAESPVRKDTIWAGSDDGLVHVTTDGGRSWTDVTPPGMGTWPMISLIEASPHDADTAYAAVTRYKMNDFRPMIYRTRDLGQTWDRITDGIDAEAFVRSVREDPERPGLLYAGTETGVWVSLNDGESWQPLQRDLPVVPVTDVAVKDDDLVIATQGRSFWILDDLTPLREHTHHALHEPVTLLPPLPAHRAGRGWGSAVRIQYHLAEPPAEPLLIEVMDDEGDVIRSWVGKAVPTEPDPDAAPPAADEDDATGATDEDDDEGDDEGELPEDAGRAPAETGMNLLRWNLRYPSATGVPGAMMWSASNVGPLAPPGTYRVRLTMGETVLDQQIVVKGDPRVETTDAEYAEQFALCQDILAQVERVNTSINRLRDVRDQVRAAMRRVEGRDGAETVDELGSAIVEALGDVEEHLIQTRLEAPQDMLNFPIRLNNKIASLMGVVEGDYAPTAQAYDVFESLVERIDERLEALQAILDDRIGPFNEAYAAAAPPAVVVNTGGE